MPRTEGTRMLDWNADGQCLDRLGHTKMMAAL